MKYIRKSEIREYWDVVNTANGLVALDVEPPPPPDLVSVPLPRLESAMAGRPDEEVRDAMERDDRAKATPVYARRMGVNE